MGLVVREIVMKLTLERKSQTIVSLWVSNCNTVMHERLMVVQVEIEAARKLKFVLFLRASRAFDEAPSF